MICFDQTKSLGTESNQATMLSVGLTCKRPEALPLHHPLNAQLLSKHVLYARKGGRLTPDQRAKFTTVTGPFPVGVCSAGLFPYYFSPLSLFPANIFPAKFFSRHFFPARPFHYCSFLTVFFRAIFSTRKSTVCNFLKVWL